jgi:hypothetical protein
MGDGSGTRADGHRRLRIFSLEHALYDVQAGLDRGRAM